MNKVSNILIVEDEPVVALAATEVLSSEGIHVEKVADAETALPKLQEKDFCMILLDIMLPGMSGFEFLEMVREKHPGLSIVTISGYATLENAIRSFQLGAFDFIAKPFDFEELLSVVRRGMIYSEQRSGKSHGDVSREGFYLMGGHSWANIDRDGSARIGVGETFTKVSGDLERVEFPKIQEEPNQGDVCLKIVTKDPLLHAVRSPLSGRVIENNVKVQDDVNLINTDPFQEGWLIRIIPANPELELSRLRAWT